MPSELWFYDEAGGVWHLQKPGSYQNAARSAVPLCGTAPIKARRFQYGGTAGPRCEACTMQQIVDEAEEVE